MSCSFSDHRDATISDDENINRCNAYEDQRIELYFH